MRREATSFAISTTNTLAAPRYACRSIKAHINLSDKGGASLSTVRLEQLVNVVGDVLKHCNEIKMDPEVRGREGPEWCVVGVLYLFYLLTDDQRHLLLQVLQAHLCSNQHRETLNHTIAASIVAIEDMQVSGGEGRGGGGEENSSGQLRLTRNSHSERIHSSAWLTWKHSEKKESSLRRFPTCSCKRRGSLMT